MPQTSAVTAQVTVQRMAHIKIDGSASACATLHRSTFVLETERNDPASLMCVCVCVVSSLLGAHHRLERTIAWRKFFSSATFWKYVCVIRQQHRVHLIGSRVQSMAQAKEEGIRFTLLCLCMRAPNYHGTCMRRMSVWTNSGTWKKKRKFSWSNRSSHHTHTHTSALGSAMCCVYNGRVEWGEKHIRFIVDQPMRMQRSTVHLLAAACLYFFDPTLLRCVSATTAP